MLGRQQIAGIPTAISELFKNAHDAYAGRVEVDYYRSDGLFVLRDDGLGMTREDFENRWLTLGTESKVKWKALAAPPADPRKPRRPILGEKGIGRLAIAAIGPQVLALTRARRGETLHDLVAAFIHWGLFECPGVDLDEIEIPLRTYPAGQLPTARDVTEMVGEFRNNIVKLRRTIGKDWFSRLDGDLSAFNPDPAEIDGYLADPSLRGDGSGTHFIIKPASELLAMDIDEEEADRASPLTKALLGFTNTMTPGHAEPAITAAFRDHKSDEVAEDLIADRLFFTPEEFLNADHHVIGEFDEYGQFHGTVSIYGQEYRDHVIPWRGARGEKTVCGPFRISVADVQGRARETTLPLEDHARLTGKMYQIGGLYIYKDGVRILPYGDTDFDWLEIEKRRSKHATFYHFSYRRMFGVVEITAERNCALSEKAGREGFRENKAYRQLRSVLVTFFVQIAADFFREQGTFADYFHERRSELDRLERARRRREKRVAARRSEFGDALQGFFARYDAEEPQAEVLELVETVEARLETASRLNVPEQVAQALLEVESDARGELNALRERYRVARPRGVGLGPPLQRDWGSYQEAYAQLADTVFAEAASLIEDTVGAQAERARLQLDRRIRIDRALRELAEEARKTAKAEAADTRSSLERVGGEVRKAVTESIGQVEKVLREVLSEFERLDVSTLDDAQAVAERNRLEVRIVQVREAEQRFLQYVRAQIEAINLGEGVGQLDEIEALEQRTLALEERAEADLQLSQLGMAVEIINHEFNSTVRSIRSSLRKLKAWADVNEALREVYGNIRANFDHLDGYLTLFTPLHRRLYRKEVEIRGENVRKFLEDLFGERIRRHQVRLRATKAFKKMVVVGYPSSFFPAFVNLVDNAIFWLKDRPDPRTIELDADADAFVVSDTGPGIPDRDREAVFELGFTRKPGGRGLGLYISREALRSIGYDLILATRAPGKGAVFRIEPKLEDEDDGEEGKEE